MYRLRLIVCLVLSDVNVFLKLNCEGEKEKKKIFQWPNHYSYFVYFALKSEERFVLPCRTTKTFVQVFSKYFFCIYCASMNKCGVDFRCKYTFFFLLT